MSIEDIGVQLELKERLNYPEHIQKAMDTIDSAFNNEKIPRSKVQDMILNFYYDIPNSWKDEAFKKDIQSITSEKTVPNTITFCGATMSKGYMKRNNIPLTKTIKIINYFKLKNAIVNLLDRLNMLVRKDKIERSTGKNLKYKNLDELIEAMEKEDNEEE